MPSKSSIKLTVPEVKVKAFKHVSKMTRDEALKAVSNRTLEHDLFEDYFPEPK